MLILIKLRNVQTSLLSLVLKIALFEVCACASLATVATCFTTCCVCFCTILRILFFRVLYVRKK